MLTRRRFLGAAAAAAFPIPFARHTARVPGSPAIDPARLRARLERLRVFGRPDGGAFESGVSRVAYSDADVAGRTWLLEEIRSAGLSPRIDAAGNVFVRWPASPPAGARPLAPILFGSHIDSVPNGGNFDG